MNDASVIHVIDDDESVRKAVTRLLKAAGYDVRGYANAGEFLLAELTDSCGCIILDVCMPGPSGMELQQALNRRQNSLPIVFLTGHGDIPMSVRAMKAGAVDFLTKPVQRQELLAAVEAALQVQREQSAASARTKYLHELYSKLTDRERAVLQYVVEGKLNKQIAATLGIAERTVKAHRSQLMAKFEATSVAELVRKAEELYRSKKE